MIFIGLGSNVGERMNNLTEGVRLLDANGVKIVKASSLYETPAWGLTDQSPFLNAVIGVSFEGQPSDILDKLMAIEQALGRTREIKWGPRTLDLDILSFEAIVCSTPELTLPHPYLQERAFVLAPWKEIAPDFSIPGLNQNPVELWGKLAPEEFSGMKIYSPGISWIQSVLPGFNVIS